MKIIQMNSESKEELLQKLRQRSPVNYGEVEKTVADIISEVREKGDAALLDMTERFDHYRMSSAKELIVTKEEIEQARKQMDPEFVDVLKRSYRRIYDFHEKQRRESWFSSSPDGSILGQRILPVEYSGVYVPGGKAAYPSSVLMNIIPAKVAGVSRIIVCTPPNREGRVDPGTLVAADLAGADVIYKVGGAQAIAAMAFGTDTIPKVDKITGPGNIYVALAKKSVFGYVSIDSVAGPSEILVLADETANPRYVAADLLSQAEHDEIASAILITTSEACAQKVSEEIDGFLKTLSRAEIIRKSLDNYGMIFVAKNEEDMIDAANEIASEHVEILTADPWSMMTKIRHAGAVFLGPWSSEPLGDYYAGPNHILPTNRTARFFSPLSVDDFVKRSSVICYSKEALLRDAADIERFAREEGLTAHANSIAVRHE